MLISWLVALSLVLSCRFQLQHLALLNCLLIEVSSTNLFPRQLKTIPLLKLRNAPRFRSFRIRLIRGLWNESLTSAISSGEQSPIVGNSKPP